jgi:hypothetical protein
MCDACRCQHQEGDRKRAEQSCQRWEGRKGEQGTCSHCSTPLQLNHLHVQGKEEEDQSYHFQSSPCSCSQWPSLSNTTLKVELIDDNHNNNKEEDKGRGWVRV